MAALPPGVYFNPSPEECVRDYLRPWTSTGAAPRNGPVFPADVYRHGPGELVVLHPPGHARGCERKWFFLTPRGGAGLGGRGKRRVATGGNWKVEQKTKDLLEDGDNEGGGGGKRRTYGFYLPDGSKTAWLMEELVDGDGGGGKGKGKGKKGVTSGDEAPVFCRVYVSPRADNDDRRAILGEEGVAVDENGKPKPSRVVVDGGYFDLLAARLPASCVRRRGHHGGYNYGHQVQAGYQQHQVVAPPPPEFFGHHQHQQQLVHHVAAPGGVHVHGHQHYYQDFLLEQHQHYNAGLLNNHNQPLPPPPVHVAAPPHNRPHDEEEEVRHVEKKPRLTQPMLMMPKTEDATTISSSAAAFPTTKTEPFHDFQAHQVSDDAVHLHQDPTPPPQEEEGTTASPPPPPVIETSTSGGEGGGSTDQSNLTHASYGNDFGLACNSYNFQLDGGDLTLDFATFPLEDILQSDGSFFDASSWIDSLEPVQAPVVDEGGFLV